MNNKIKFSLYVFANPLKRPAVNPSVPGLVSYIRGMNINKGLDKLVGDKVPTLTTMCVKNDAKVFGDYHSIKHLMGISDSSGMVSISDLIHYRIRLIRKNTWNSGGYNMNDKKLLGISEKWNSTFNNYKDRVIYSAFNFCKDEIKKSIGKEFIFSAYNHKGSIRVIIDKFIKKYDKNYKNHITKTEDGKEHIINKRILIPIRKDTFIYIETGNKIGKSKELYMMQESTSAMDMYIYIFGKKSNYLAQEIESIIHESYNINQLGLFNVDSQYSKDPNADSLYVTFTPLALRSLDTLFFSHGEKEKICNHIDRFISNKSFYTERQLLYKTGIILYGEPGTGKSSLVKALASKYNRNVVNINTSNIKSIDLNKLTLSINVDLAREYIILIEDIDTLFLNRKDSKSDKEDHAVINKLLQFLDSNSSPNNVIFIATTNHLDRLDEALLREGRFDLKVEIKALKDKDSVIFGESFTLSRDEAEKLVENIHKEMPEKDLINQSLLQAKVLSKIENKSFDDIEKLHGVMEE